jgi:hypothetical protein
MQLMQVLAFKLTSVSQSALVQSTQIKVLASLKAQALVHLAGRQSNGQAHR